MKANGVWVYWEGVQNYLLNLRGYRCNTTGQMTLSRAVKNLHRELLINAKASAIKQNAQDLQKRIALLKYQRVNALKNQQTDKIRQIDQELKQAEQHSQEPEVTLDATLLGGLQITKNADSKHSADHINDVANFLSYQRTYQELIERYNPGLRMTQEDKIRRTAHKVGFELPEEFNK